MDCNKIKKLISSIHSPKILVVGDLMLDRYVLGKVDRISPEAPVQIFEVEREEVRLGGAGNAIHNMVTLGAQVSCLGSVGKDSSGKKIQKLLQNLLVDVEGVFFTPYKSTTIKTRLLAQNQQVIRMDQEEKSELTKKHQERTSNFLHKNLKKFDLIVLSDYGKGFLSVSLLSEIFEEAQKLNIPTLVDPKEGDFTRYQGATTITPNQKEAELATGISYTDQNSLEKMSHWLLSHLKLECSIITMGNQGIFLELKNREKHHFPAKARSVYDVTGAGDTVIAALAVLIASGVEFKEAVQFANCAAAVVVGKVGTSTVTPKEILQQASKKEKKTSLISLISIEDLLPLLKHFRQLGEKIVFTNGCFDLIHLGHIHYLKEAKKKGNVLIVALNSDESIQKIKGKNRPFLPLETRQAILSSMRMVDYVVTFDEPTPLHLIQAIQPDFLIKGEDYRNKMVVGREIVESYGGKVELIPLFSGYSSTDLARKISEKYSKENSQEREEWEL